MSCQSHIKHTLDIAKSVLLNISYNMQFVTVAGVNTWNINEYKYVRNVRKSTDESIKWMK